MRLIQTDARHEVYSTAIGTPLGVKVCEVISLGGKSVNNLSKTACNRLTHPVLALSLKLDLPTSHEGW
jgi:hypothetical protein